MASERPQRIVSLVPSLTEALFVFGAGERVVGRTRYCTLPARTVRRAAVVGGTKRIDHEKTLSLNPDLVVAVREENAREDVERLREAGVPVFLGEPQTVSGAISMLRDLAAAVGAADTSSLDRAGRTLERLRRVRPERPVRVFAPIWKSPFMSPGGDTYVSSVIEECGGFNVFADRRRYPTVTPEEIEAARPEVVLLPDEPYEFSAADLAELYALDVPAAREERIHLVSGKILTWYGPRLADSLTQLAALLRRQ